MNIAIATPCAISEKGSRLNNEDAVYPLPEVASSEHKLFMVCDGVGGAEKGEVASALACEAFQTFFSTFKEEPVEAGYVQRAVQYVESRFDEYVASRPEAKGMATTFTLVYLGEEGAVLAHVGDSRIYHFRKGEIRYRTTDHSLVSSLVSLGKITEEKAREHPQRNVILRAIQGTNHATEADIVVLNNIQPGDYLFMCTDGVQERFTDHDLSALFAAPQSPEQIRDRILDMCYGRTRDNFSFYLIPINNVQETQGLKQNIFGFLYSFV